MRNFKPLANLRSCAGRFESHIVKKTRRYFFSNEAQIPETGNYKTLDFLHATPSSFACIFFAIFVQSHICLAAYRRQITIAKCNVEVVKCLPVLQYILNPNR